MEFKHNNFMTHYIKNLITSATIIVALATVGTSVAKADEITGTLSSNGSYSATVVTTNTNSVSSAVASTGGGGGGGGNGPIVGSLPTGAGGGGGGSVGGNSGSGSGGSNVTFESNPVTTGSAPASGVATVTFVPTGAGGITPPQVATTVTIPNLQTSANQNANQLADVVVSGAGLDSWLLWIFLALLLIAIGYYLYQPNRNLKKGYNKNSNNNV
jgi:hypothetical protein